VEQFICREWGFFMPSFVAGSTYRARAVPSFVGRFAYRSSAGLSFGG